MTILLGFEAEYVPMREAYLGEIRKDIDYMILGQHFVQNGLNITNPNNNPNYPIEYAHSVCKAIDSGLFDIVAHPDIFMRYRKSIRDENDRKLFDENAVIASQIICEKARDMGIPVEINLAGKEDYPNIIFWQVASEIKRLKVLCGIDAHNLNAFTMISDKYSSVRGIINLVKDKLLSNDYNPKLARENNPKLQQALKRGQASALSFETHMINQILEASIRNADEGIDSEQVAILMANALNAVERNCVTSEEEQRKLLEQNLKEATNDNSFKSERIRSAINENKVILEFQKNVIKNAKNNIISAIELGCSSKEELVNIITQLTESHSTSNAEHKAQIEENIGRFQSVKSGNPINAEELKNSNKVLELRNDSNGGFVSITVLILGLTFVVGITIGILLMLIR